MLAGAKKDPQIITDAWQKLDALIDGVAVREVLHVPRDHGIITELYRPQWDPTGMPVVHARTVDRLVVNQGNLKVAHYDGRDDSPTAGKINELHVGDARPALVVAPIGVWRDLQNLGDSDALVLDFPSNAYDYADPDHYRLPADTTEIPYTRNTRGAAARLGSDAK